MTNRKDAITKKLVSNGWSRKEIFSKNGTNIIIDYDAREIKGNKKQEEIDDIELLHDINTLVDYIKRTKK